MMSLDEHSASGSAAGYVFQFERALYWLARSPAGFKIGVETCDDVAISHADGKLTLEQDKHSVRPDAKPFGDRSRDLWNTLAIWHEALSSGEIDGENSYFLLVTNKTLDDCLAKKISDSNSEDEIESCISSLLEAGENPPETIKKWVAILRSTPNDKHLRSIIRNCRLLDGSLKTGGDQLRSSTVSELQIPDGFISASSSILEELLGWLTSQVLLKWQNGESAWICRNHFVNRFYAVLDERKRRLSRERSANLIPVPDEEVGNERSSNFVKQLYLVTDEDSRIDDSIRETIRCSMEKTRLSEEGNVTDQDWINFEDALSSRWKKISSSQQRLHRAEDERDIGFRILSETTDDHREILAGVETEQVYLTAGTYHRMSDSLKVGWHPRYIELMKEDSDE